VIKPVKPKLSMKGADQLYAVRNAGKMIRLGNVLRRRIPPLEKSQ